MKQYCYYYEYNSKHQLVTKQLPGKDPIYLKYDGKYRLRMTQDGVQRLTGKWMFINYDNLGRTVSTGLGVLDGQNPNIPDTISPTPVISDYTYQYYDGYGFISDPNLAFDASSAFHQIAVSTVGSVTGSKVRVMGQSVEKWLTSVVYYDKYGRVIQSIAQNAKGGYDMVNNAYNFAGELITSRHKHTVSGSSAKYLVYTYQYDDFGRLINVKLSQNENGSNWIIVDNLSYDETGHVKQKKIHSDDQLSYLQTVDYYYNVKGALTGINNPSDLGNDLFAYELFYDSKPDHITNPVYQDGKISAMQWNSKNLNAVQTYGFTYDNANRLTSASFSPDNKYDMTFTYDKNGNITNLTRKGQIITQSPPSGGLGGPVQNIGYGWIDNLTYVYSGNKLQSVNDSYGSLNSQLNNDFRDNGSQTQTEYFYDVNGNMTRDNNKGITSVTYNHLNQPVEVVLSGKRTKYTYTSTGLKLKTEVYVDDKLQSVTEYIGAFVYEDAKLSYINIPDGRYVIATGKYEYNLTDHLGNVRVTFTKGSDNKATIIEEDHYYPFGLQMSGQHFQNTGFLNKYLYNGKEKQDQTGYYDYGFRQLDPQLGRWHVVDALAEKFADESPYNYAGNNPVSNIDIAGLQKYTLNEKIVYSMFGTSEFQRGGGGITRNVGPTNKDHSDYEKLSEEAKNGMDFQTWYNEKSKHQYDNYSTYGTNINNTGGHWEWRRKAYSQKVEYQKVIINGKEYTTLVPIEAINQRVWVNDKMDVFQNYGYYSADAFISIGPQGGWKGEFFNPHSIELVGLHLKKGETPRIYTNDTRDLNLRRNLEFDVGFMDIGFKQLNNITNNLTFENYNKEQAYELSLGASKIFGIEVYLDENFNYSGAFVGLSYNYKIAAILGFDSEIKLGFKF